MGTSKSVSPVAYELLKNENEKLRVDIERLREIATNSKWEIIRLEDKLKELKGKA